MKIAGIQIEVKNAGYKDTVGREIKEGDYILIYNDTQDNNAVGWSYEKVARGNDGILYGVFEKYLGPVYTDLTQIPCNKLVVVRSIDGSTLFHNDAIVFNKTTEFPR